MLDLLHLIAKLLPPQGEPLLAGVSGGLDSMVLMHLLAKRWKVHVAHLNHQLRGRSSDADERLVRNTAKNLGLPCHIERADVKAPARTERLSIEMAARQWRHEFYARLARKLGIPRIALAHHADDQVELFFLRLFRGAGQKGLAGMSETALSFVDPSLTILRPLLGVTREQLRAYAAENKIPFREDATNASLSVLRNRIRHQLIPLLKKNYQPGLAQTIPRVMDLLRAESEFVSEQAATRREPFDKLPVALQRRRLQDELYAAGIEATFDLVEHLRLHPKAPITIDPHRTVSRDPTGRLTLADSNRSNLSAPTATSPIVEIHAESGSVDLQGVEIQWSITTRTGKPARNREYFDANRIGFPIMLRHWQPGDRFQPIGMPAAVKLQDLFTNQKIPRPKRHQLIIATTAAGDIFWVEGLRIGEQFKLQPSTRRRLQWRWRRHETPSA